jgi:hypothetical protein
METTMLRFAFALALALIAAPALADPIHVEIATALKAYDSGDMRAAKNALDTASQQIAQRNAQLLSTVLPPVFAGWTGDKPEIVGIGNILGGMITAKRSYHSGNNTVTLTILGDSPMLAAFMALISNPQIAMLSGGKIVTVAGHQALITSDGQIQMAIGNRWFITVEGNAPVPQKQAYLNAVNFRALAALR